MFPHTVIISKEKIMFEIEIFGWVIEVSVENFLSMPDLIYERKKKLTCN